MITALFAIWFTASLGSALWIVGVCALNAGSGRTERRDAQTQSDQGSTASHPPEIAAQIP